MAVAVEAAILVGVMQRRVPFEYKLTHKTAMGRVPQYVFVYTMTVPLIAAEASHFCLGKSNQNRVRRNASLRGRPLPANREKPWAATSFAG